VPPCTLRRYDIRAVAHVQPCRSNHVGHVSRPSPEVRKACHARLGARRTHAVRHSLRSVHLVQQILATISTSTLWLHTPLANRAAHRADCKRPRHLASSAAVAVAVIFSPIRRPLPAPPTPRQLLPSQFPCSARHSPTADQIGGFVRAWPDEP
jgi:hypothetical protein